MLLRLLGRGGMGEVFLARDMRLGRKVALKMVSGGTLSETAKQRFLFEARVTARFNHPNIVTIHDVGEHEGRPYVALEYLDGDNLRERLRSARFSEREAMRVAMVVAEALAEAHGHGVLHRDLKPENVIIPHDGRLRVVDFGLARPFVESETHGLLPEPAAAAAPPADLASGADERGTSPGTEETTATLDESELAQSVERRTIDEGEGDVLGDAVLSSGRRRAGTPLYMAPEQWKAEPTTPATDVWALGLMLREMLTGAHVHGGLGLLDIYARVASAESLPALGLDEASSEVASLVAQCTAKAPSARPSASEVARTLHALLDPQLSRGEAEENPFRGLLPLTEQHAARFFGRETETLALVERLRDEPMIAVVGPSGVGKSSLIQAGVVPRLRERTRWVMLPLRPGRQPLRALATRLVRGEVTGSDSRSGFDAGPEPEHTADALYEALRRAPGRLALELQRLAREEKANVLLFIDQLEEVFTLVEDAEERRCFLEAVCASADEPDGPVRTVVTLRDDFLGRAAEVPTARDALRNTLLVGALGAAALADTIGQLVSSAGYAFDDPAVLQSMGNAVEGEPSALPLLQVVGLALWERRDRQKRTLLRSAYDALGGVEGALASQADAAIQGLTDDQIAVLRLILLRLITPEGTRRVVPRAQLLDGLDAGADSLLQRMVQARLLTARRGLGTGEDAEVELTHESLVRTWKRLRRWVDEDRDDLLFADEIQNAAQLWARRGRPDEEVWRGNALLQAIERAERLPGGVPPAVRDFLEAGRRLARRGARRRRMALGALLAVLSTIALGSGLVAIWVASKNTEIDRRRAQAEELKSVADARREEAEASREEATHSRGEALREAALGAFQRGDVLTARAMTRAALEAADSLETRALWMQLERAQLVWSSNLCELYSRETVRFVSPEQLLMLCWDYSVESVDTRTGRRFVVSPHNNTTLEVSASGLIAVARDNGTVELRRSADAPPYRVLTSPGGMPQHSLSFTVDGRLLAGSGAFVEARPVVWDTTSGEVVATYQGHRHELRKVALSPDGRWAASTAVDEPAHVWSVTTGEKVRELVAEPVLEGFEDVSVAFDRTGARLAVGARDGVTRVYDVASWQEVARFAGDAAGHVVWSVAFSDDGQRLAAAGTNQEAWIWELDSGRLSSRLEGHQQHVLSVAFSPDGELFATIAADGVRLWNISPLARPAARLEIDRGYLVTGNDDGSRLATAGIGPDAVLWDGRTGQPLVALRGHTQDLYQLAFAADGRLATGAADATLRLWDADGVLQRAFTLERDEIPRRIQWGGGQLWAVTTAGLVEFSGDALRRPAGSTAAEPGSAIAVAGRVGASGVGEPSARVWDLESGQTLTTIEAHDKPIQFLALAPNGERLATASIDGELRVWALPSGGRLAHWRLPAALSSKALDEWMEMTFSPDGGHLGLTLSSLAILWDLGAPAPRILPGLSYCGAGFSGDSARFYAGSCWSGAPQAWETASARPVWAARGLIDEPAAYLDAGGWHRFDGGELTRDAFLTSAAERASRCDRRGDRACLARYDGELEIWRASAAEPLRSVQVPGTPERVYAVSGGCVVTTVEREAWMYPADGVVVPLASDVVAVSVRNDQLLILRDDGVELRAGSGEVLATAGSANSPRFGGLGDDEILEGHVGGRVVSMGLDGQPRSEFLLEGSDAVDTGVMSTGPVGTLVVGQGDGQLGVWDRGAGRRIDAIRALGAIDDLFVRDGVVFALSERGEALSLDLRPLADPPCVFLKRVWERQPAVWDGGQVRLAAPTQSCAP